jgi:hypothetical protein
MRMGKAQSDISATIQRQYAHEESPKRYICNNTAPLCAWGKSKALYLQQYRANMRMGKAQIDISATIQRHYAHEERSKRYICDNTAPLCAWGKSKAIYLQQYSATMRMEKAQSHISATIQRHYAHGEGPKRYICNNTAPLCAWGKSKAIYL